MGNQVKEIGLRALIREILRKKSLCEETLRNVPDFVFKQATDDLISTVRTHIRQYVQQNSRSLEDTKYVEQIVEDVLKELADEINELIKDRLVDFTQRI